MIATETTFPNSEKPTRLGGDSSFGIPEVLHTRTVQEVLQDTSALDRHRWLLADTLPHPGFTVVYGAPKCGKTTLLTHLCASVVAGTKFLEREVLSGPVLWFDLEQHITLTAENLESAGAVGHQHEVHIFNGPPPKLKQLLATVEKIQPVVVVVDSLSRL